MKYLKANDSALQIHPGIIIWMNEWMQEGPGDDVAGCVPVYVWGRVYVGVCVCVWLSRGGGNLFVVVSHMAPFPAGPRDVLKRCQKNSPKAVSFYCWESAGSLPLSPPHPLLFYCWDKADPLLNSLCLPGVADPTAWRAGVCRGGNPPALSPAPLIWNEDI